MPHKQIYNSTYVMNLAIEVNVYFLVSLKEIGFR